MPGQRNTSKRRKGLGGAAGRALPGLHEAGRVAVDTTPGPLAYDGDDADTCEVCGTRLEPAGTGKVRRHARYGWRPTPTRPPCRGGELDVVIRATRLPLLDEHAARHDRLVTRAMIARRYGWTAAQVSHYIAEQPAFPKPVARLSPADGKRGSGGLLYPADRVLQHMRHVDPTYQPQAG